MTFFSILTEPWDHRASYYVRHSISTVGLRAVFDDIASSILNIFAFVFVGLYYILHIHALTKVSVPTKTVAYPSDLIYVAFEHVMTKGRRVSLLE